jgi:seryl-tRNA synthetase
MLDPALLREDPERVRRSMERRGLQIDIERLVELDTRRRQARHAAEEMRAEQRALGKTIARLDGEEKQEAIAGASRMADSYQALAAQVEELDSLFLAEWADLPNLVDDTAADGLTEEDSVEIRRVGDPPVFDGEPPDHQELGEALGVIDMERAAKVSGSRFAYLAGEAVLLELALLRWAIDRVARHGFTPVMPPVLVREHALYGTGFFPEARDQVYAVEADDLFLVGTSEVSLAARHSDEILDLSEGPIRYAGISTCFRREAGTYGKDTRGVFRVHQFDKVEMFSFTRPDEAISEHELLLGIEEEIFTDLGIPYRVVNTAAGDLGPAATKKYDIEAWFPSQQRYRELTSCSNTTDYQARRLRIRHRGEAGTELVHTLNGTAMAVPRTVAAIMENFQQPDGSVLIPEPLHSYTGFDLMTRRT